MSESHGITDVERALFPDADPERPFFPGAEVELSGTDSSSMVIIGLTRRVLRRAGATEEQLAAFSREATAGDHDHVIQTVMRWAEVS